MTTSTKRPDEVLRALEPYIDCIICYASTVDEHEGNRVAKMARDYFATPANESPALHAEALDDKASFVAHAIAERGFGRAWDDFLPVNAYDTDQGDLLEYAHAAVTALRERRAKALYEAQPLKDRLDDNGDPIPWEGLADFCKEYHYEHLAAPAPQPPVEGLREWFNSFRGDHGKTEWDQLLSILASPSLTAEENTKSDGEFEPGPGCQMVRTCVDGKYCYGHCKTGPSDAPLEDALGHLGSVLSILAELHPDDRSRALDNALAFYNARRPGAQVEPVAGVTRLVHQWPGPSDPSPPAPDVREAMHRASEAEAEAGRLSYLIKEGIYSEYDDKMVSLSIMDESEASIGMYGPVYLALADTHQIIPSRLFEAMVTSLGDNFEKLQAIYAEDSTLSAQPAKGER